MLADVMFTTEGLVIIGALLTALVGAIGILWKVLQDNHTARLADKDANFALLLADKEKQLALQTQETNSWKQIGAEAVVNLRKAANAKRAAAGEAAMEVLVPVVEEHSSPATPQQIATAELQTVRAALVAVTKDLGLPARDVEGAVTASTILPIRPMPVNELVPEIFDSPGRPLATKDKAAVAAEMTKQVADELDTAKLDTKKSEE